MSRPNWFIKLNEWLARLKISKRQYGTETTTTRNGTLSAMVDEDTQQGYVDPLIKEVFEGAPDEFIYNLSNFSDTDPRLVYMGWASAKSPIPTKLSPMYLMRTEWVLWYDNGKVEVVDLPRTGGWDINGNYTNYPHQPIMSMPLGVIKAAKVGSGGCGEPQGASGLRWELYVL